MVESDENPYKQLVPYKEVEYISSLSQKYILQNNVGSKAPPLSWAMGNS